MQASRQDKLHRASIAIKVATIVAFIGVAGVITASAFWAGQKVELQEIASEDNTPRAWGKVQSANAVANSSLSAEVRDGRYVEYTAELRNANAKEGLKVTHLAAYLSTDGYDKDGFVAMAGGNLEYSYTPSKSESWEGITVTQPANGGEAFRLGKEVHLGAAGTKTDTVYFRFYVEPGDQETVTVSNKVSFLMQSDSGELGYAGSTATVAYYDLGTTVATTEGAGAGDDDVSNAYTNPLGRSSFVPEVDAVSETVASAAGGGGVNVWVWGVVGVIGVGVFVACLLLYLPLRKY